ncbi:fibronectin type III domain-containing protein [Pricia sp. S334]|uniref:Fibronectin type III domain-containing protein n=1 Tax=Pricia mediterranea TaxID=3076079 RepID=A0ABU3LA77_9FLAO|nr:fibronectin type III domain-containing protein [Pricia sp. S334]MDT7830650.1 fibronectin type III domain-containing protein [Pricia sp. S334]
MKSIPLLLLALCLISAKKLSAQNAHTHANAASIDNEANTVTGWSGDAVISSDATDPHDGNFSIRAVSTASNGRTLTYTYNAQIGDEYTIRIWAKEGPQVSSPAAPAFAVWSGMTGFSTTLIQGTEWTEYVFNVTATSTSPLIRIYTSNRATRNTAGNTIFIDNISILPASDVEPPSAVTTLMASGTTTTGTELSWTASTDNVGIAEYHVYQDAAIVGTTTDPSYTVTSLTENTSYDFTVRAIDAAGNVSAAGNTVSVTTLPASDQEAPSAVTSLGASNTTATGTELSWTASTDNVGIAEYQVYQDAVIVTTTAGTSYTVTSLTENTSYDFTVRAIDAAGNVSAAGNTVSVTTLPASDQEAPSAVTSLEASNTTATGTELSWTASTDNVGIAEYHVYQDATILATTSDPSYTVTSLTESTSYDFSVRAIDAAGNVSAAGNTVNITTLATGTEVIDYTSDNANLPTVDWEAKNIFAAQTMGIGTTDTQGYTLAVAGGVVAERVKIALQTDWPDFVFEEKYSLPTLYEVEKHIQEKGHLLDVPSAKVVEAEGIDVGAMNALLLQKIEELTLYLLQQDKKITELEAKVKKMDQVRKLVKKK